VRVRGGEGGEAQKEGNEPPYGRDLSPRDSTLRLQYDRGSEAQSEHTHGEVPTHTGKRLTAASSIILFSYSPHAIIQIPSLSVPSAINNLFHSDTHSSHII
jgi:hypothetical protein